MCGHDHGDPLISEPTSQSYEARRACCIQFSGRLVGDHNSGRPNCGHREGKTLLLPARQLIRPVLEAMIDTQELQDGEALGAPCPADPGRQIHVLRHCEVRDQILRRTLENVANESLADLPTKTSPHTGQILVPHHHGAEGRAIEPRQDPEKGRLAAPRRPRQSGHTAGREVTVHIPKRPGLAARTAIHLGDLSAISGGRIVVHALTLEETEPAYYTCRRFSSIYVQGQVIFLGPAKGFRTVPNRQEALLRRAVVVAVTLGLLAGAAVAPAEAKKKKKKAPVTFTAEGSFALGNPGDLNDAGITRQEFLAQCAVPATQGLDGFVIELDDKISAVTSNAQVTGGDASGMHDLDLYFFDDACAPTGSSSTAAADEFGVMPAGTQYVLVTAFTGLEVTFSFEAIEIR